MSIKNKHIVISGGGSGVGAGIARAFQGEGANVTLLGRTRETLEAQSLYYQVCDVGDPAAVQSACSDARAEFGPISIVVANAGIASSQPFGQLKSTELERMLKVNVHGVVNLWQAGLEDMVAAGWGRMLAVASTAGLKGYPYVSAYCASKHAVVGLTRSLAVELARKGITVNAICPGYTDTPLLQRSVANIVEKTGMTEADARASLLKVNPQRRFVSVEEVAACAVFLCGEQSQSVNGQALGLTGGEL